MTDVDLDRLADYVGGALDGTPEASAVAGLVMTDPSWAHAYAALLTADAAVRLDLASLAAIPESMPSDVMIRLSAALASLPRPDEPASSAGPISTGPISTGSVSSMGTARSGGSTSPGRHMSPSGRASARQRRRRLALVLTAAAVAVVCGLGVVTALPGLWRSGYRSAATATSGKDTGEPAPPPGGAGTAGEARPSSSTRVVASGTNYGPDSVTGVGARTLMPGARVADSGLDARAAPGAGHGTAPDALGRLTDPVARSTCIGTITREYGGEVTLVDYARYEGAPALVVLISGAFGSPDRQWVVAVGAQCGEGGAIAKVLLYSGSAR